MSLGSCHAHVGRYENFFQIIPHGVVRFAGMEQVHDPSEPTLLGALDSGLGLTLVFGAVTFENAEHYPTIQAYFARTVS